MKKATNESVETARQITGFLNEYVPSQKTNSSHTQKVYQSALQLYISFLESEKKVGLTDFGSKWFERSVIDEWLNWPKAVAHLKNIYWKSITTYLIWRRMYFIPEIPERMEKLT